jgi:hypothetical protein
MTQSVCVSHLSDRECECVTQSVLFRLSSRRCEHISHSLYAYHVK